MFTKTVTFPYLIVIIPALLLNGYIMTNVLALNAGGGIAMGIINLNMFLTMLLGAYFYGDKINIKIAICAVVAASAMSIAVYESSIIN